VNDRQLRYILEIAKEGSISSAAQRLYISQPSLSGLLVHVEKETGAKLFDRSVTPMVPTFAGEKYIEAAEKILLTMEELQSLIDDIGESRRGRLRIGCGPQHSPFIIPLLLPEMIKLYPDVDFHITEELRSVLEAELLAGKLDILLYGGKNENPVLHYEELSSNECVLLAPKGYRAAILEGKGGRPFPCIDLHTLAHENFVLMKKGHQLRIMQDHVLSEMQFNPNVILETDNWQTSIRLVESGVAFTILPNEDTGFFRHDFEKYALEKTFKRTLRLCYRKNAYITKVMADFIAMTRRLFGGRG
jgi:DNA-binding transcriptional LysR family regulator